LEVIFNGDPIQGGLLLDEEEIWQAHRKAMSKMLHLDVLNHYIEYMDISAAIFTEQLCNTGHRFSRFKRLFRQKVCSKMSKKIFKTFVCKEKYIIIFPTVRFLSRKTASFSKNLKNIL